MCSGEYIAFVDSDDYILPEMYEKMLAVQLEHQVDICVCQWQYEYEDGRRGIDPNKIDSNLYGKKPPSNLLSGLTGHTMRPS